MSILGQIKCRLFGVSSARSVFERDGFSPLAWTRFHDVAETLVHGYHAALADPSPALLESELSRAPAELRGIAYEGAGMGLAALDLVTPRADYVAGFAAGPAINYLYPFYVGVGLAYARLRRSPQNHLATSDPVLGWVAVDGYGFHEAFFRRRPHPPIVELPQSLTRYGRELFDQGVGRALWFSLGGDAELVMFHLRGFDDQRQSALWGGVGLAASYCGGHPDQLRTLAAGGRDFKPQLAVGSAIAAWGRDVADGHAPHTDTACQIFAGMPAVTAAAIAEQARASVRLFSPRPAMEEWRSRIATRIAEQPSAQNLLHPIPARQ